MLGCSWRPREAAPPDIRLPICRVAEGTPDRSSPQFADYLLEIAEHYRAADTIYLVMDNLSSRSRKAVVERYREKSGVGLGDRSTRHYTPTHGSWLNQA